VLVVFERRSGKPVMFHMAFKAGYHHEVVLHLGLVMVSPQHQGQHLQRLCMLNMVLACLTYFTPSYVMTDIAASPSATKQVGDHMLDCFPNYRHNCSPAAGGGPQAWSDGALEVVSAASLAGVGDVVGEPDALAYSPPPASLSLAPGGGGAGVA
jgi:hypothetical protein